MSVATSWIGLAGATAARDDLGPTCCPGLVQFSLSGPRDRAKASYHLAHVHQGRARIRGAQRTQIIPHFVFTETEGRRWHGFSRCSVAATAYAQTAGRVADSHTVGRTSRGTRWYRTWVWPLVFATLGQFCSVNCSKLETVVVARSCCRVVGFVWGWFFVVIDITEPGMPVKNNMIF